MERYAKGVAFVAVEPEAVVGVREAIWILGPGSWESSSSSPDEDDTASVGGTSWIPEVDGRSVGRKGGTTGGFVEAEDVCLAVALVGGMVVGSALGFAFLG